MRKKKCFEKNRDQDRSGPRSEPIRTGPNRDQDRSGPVFKKFLIAIWTSFHKSPDRDQDRSGPDRNQDFFENLNIPKSPDQSWSVLIGPDHDQDQ